MKKFLNQQKGITLIALVVTIIVMAILVAVSIRMTTGNNGVINQAKKTASDAGLEDIKVEIQSDVLAKEIENLFKDFE